MAQITPILKKPGLDVDDPASYRPISNLNTISKILERLFLARLAPQIWKSPCYNIFQSIALDLSAAFDTLDHTTILLRLQRSFGITGSALSWGLLLVDRSSWRLVTLGPRPCGVSSAYRRAVYWGQIFSPVTSPLSRGSSHRLASNFTSTQTIPNYTLGCHQPTWLSQLI